jgi:chemotaxis protein methyltransferase CheR
MTAAARSPRPASIDPASLAVFSRLADRLGGLSIGPGKEDFLVARLRHRLSALGLEDLAAYAAHLQSPAGAAEATPFIEALTTHTTRFFRERVQYDWLRDAGLPSLETRGAGLSRDLVIWSAACSTGQELYSAMMTAASLGLRDGAELRLRGVGTDLSQVVLATAGRAVYTTEEIADIPLELRRRFLLSARDDSDRVRIGPDLRRRARWAQANLADATTLPPLTADIAMLRNVLIYFDAPTRDRVLRNVIARIGQGGYLLTGHSETIDARAYGLTAIRPSIYRKGTE